MDKRERAKAILEQGHAVNHPHPNRSGHRIVGWSVPEEIAGLSEGVFAIEEIEIAARSRFKSD